MSHQKCSRFHLAFVGGDGGRGGAGVHRRDRGDMGGVLAIT